MFYSIHIYVLKRNKKVYIFDSYNTVNIKTWLKQNQLLLKQAIYAKKLINFCIIFTQTKTCFNMETITFKLNRANTFLAKIRSHVDTKLLKT